MKLHELISKYIAYKESFEERFGRSSRYLLIQFEKEIGKDVLLKDISKEIIMNFLSGKAEKITESWFIRRRLLNGLFNYALSREYINEIPLPVFAPQKPPRFIPYIYSDDELKRLFDAALTYQRGYTLTDPHMIRCMLILTYTLGLRRREILLIKLKDVDLERHTILIEQSKFYKTRLVTFNEQVKTVILNYLSLRKRKGTLQDADSYLFTRKSNLPLSGETLDTIFSKIRIEAGIKRDDGATYQPRIYDLRHTFATKRLIDWYEEGKDVQQLLPILSTFLGHHRLSYTSVYLTMTDKLLEEANTLFNNYVNKKIL